MKKTITISALSVALILLFFYASFGKSAEYQILPPDDYPEFIQAAVRGNFKKDGFSVFQDEKNTYIYYNSDSSPNEYITTDIDLKHKGGTYTAVATVKPAVNIPTTEKLIKLSKITDKDLVLKVKNK